MPAITEQPLSAPAISTFERKVRPIEVSMLAVFSFVLWSGCLAIGVVGFVFPYTRPAPRTKPAPVIKAEMLQVELTSEPIRAMVEPAPTAALTPPSLPEIPIAPPDVPRLTAVAEPTAVVFALPVEGPVHIVEPAQASFVAAPVVEANPIAAPPVQVLTYGSGEGRQPAPEYPLRARREGQEGAVRIRFSVGEDGRVLTAEAVQPSPWKLLNDAAVRVVQERWRFTRGTVRLYEVSIRFQLSK